MVGCSIFSTWGAVNKQKQKTRPKNRGPEDPKSWGLCCTIAVNYSKGTTIQPISANATSNISNNAISNYPLTSLTLRVVYTAILESQTCIPKVRDCAPCLSRLLCIWPLTLVQQHASSLEHNEAFTKWHYIRLAPNMLARVAHNNWSLQWRLSLQVHWLLVTKWMLSVA